MSRPLRPKKKLLIIDDNPGILFIMQEALELKGYDVSVAEKFAGIERVRKGAPDLIYLDISLIGQDGREIARELKHDKRTKHVPIIILTAHPHASRLAREAGADSFLSKPFELEHLWEMTAKYVLKRNGGK
ncbi:MAG: response regulator [Parcubacteria group bacterium]